MSRLYPIGLSLLLVLLACVAYVVISTGVFIDTNIKNVAPEMQQADVVVDALERTAQSVETKLTVVLSSDSEDVLERAIWDAQDFISEQLQTLSLLDQSALLSPYLDLVKQNPFFFLSSDAADMLSVADDKALYTIIYRRLFSQSSLSNIVSMQDDPSGFLNDYLSKTLNKVLSNEEEILIVDDRYYTKIMLAYTPSEHAAQGVDDDFLALNDFLSASYPNVEIVHSGFFFFSKEATRSAKQDIGFISTGSIIGIVILLLLVFRSIKPMFLPLVSIAFGVAFAFFFAHSVFSGLHILTIVFGASLIGVVVDYSLHYFYFLAKEDAANKRSLYRALTLSMLTSLIGYSALSFSGLTILTQVALFSASGLVFSWAMVLLLGRFFVSGSVCVHDRYFVCLVRWVFALLNRVPPQVLFGFYGVFFVLASVLVTMRLSADDSPRSFFNLDETLIANEQKINTVFTQGSYEPASFVLVKANNEADLYQHLHSVHELANTYVSTGDVLSLQQFLPSQSDQVKNYLVQARLYAPDSPLFQVLSEQGVDVEVLSALAKRYHDVVHDYVSPHMFVEALGDDFNLFWLQDDRVFYSLVFLPQAMDLNGFKLALESLQGVTYLNVVDETEERIQSLRVSAMVMLALAMIIVLGLLRCFFPGWRCLKLISVPAVSILSCLFVLSLFSVSLTLFHVMAFFLVLGLGMDYVIFTEEMEGDISHTLSAILVSSITSLLSFGLLSLSSMPVVSAFGLTVFIGNTMNVFGCFLYAFNKQQTSCRI